MHRLLLAYVRVVDGLNRRVGRVMMYGIFAMMAILLWSAFTKVGSDMGFGINPSLWTLEMAQFAMVAYYILGGPYSIQIGSNVRMDLFYGNWSNRKRAWVDAFTVLFLICYLFVLLWGGVSSASYSLGHFSGEPITFFSGIIGAFFTGGAEAVAEEVGFMERSATAWRPYLWPIKLIMVLGIFLMLLQAVSEFFKDILRIRGITI
ncbi:TRAP transporter small permease subunit [Oricola cellulosilytica]|uniref:TRAP transporter small permease protein n=1 Tax=Oricola cellulosilytica TaxID=1429082 RepID=A0A4R0P3I1_9HYPH|nr:TRAP transporter small permease subunit [Oricola cellulosilytica]TCD11400.1 TRAP transporter small permease subunit [Oricola cellulosilytica]